MVCLFSAFVHWRLQVSTSCLCLLSIGPGWKSKFSMSAVKIYTFSNKCKKKTKKKQPSRVKKKKIPFWFVYFCIFKLEVVSSISSNDFICKGHFTCNKECHSACENIFLMSSLALKGAFRKSEKITKSAGLSRIGLGEYKFQLSRKAFGYRSGWTWDFERHLPGRESLRKDASELHYEMIRVFFKDCYMYKSWWKCDVLMSPFSA